MSLCFDRQITCMFGIGTPALLWYLFSTSNRAIADGAVSFYIHHLSSTRVAKLTYGIRCDVVFDSSRADHVSRENTKFLNLSGCWMLPNAFMSIVKKVLLSSDCHSTKPDIFQGTRISEQHGFRSPYFVLGKSATECTSISIKIISYKGSLSDPSWMDFEPGEYSLRRRHLASGNLHLM